MNAFNLKKEIEEKKIALEMLIKQCGKEEKKLFLLKNNKKISEIKKQIEALEEEISQLEKTYKHQLELKKTSSNAFEKIAVFAKKNGLKTVTGCAVACTVYCGYSYFKPLTVNGEQTTYRSMIESYENIEISSSNYTPETYEQYMQNLKDAENQKFNLFMSDEEKLAYIGALLSSYDALELKPDKNSLLSALNDAKKYDVSTYTPASVETFKSIISKTQKIYDDPNATKKEVTEAETNIANAYNILTLKADKAELTELYSKYTSYTLDEYTPLSVNSFNTEIQKTEKLINNENASQKQVDEQVQVMQSIETILVKKADKTSLKALIDECNSLDRNNYSKGFDELLSAITSSTTVLNNDNATQEEVNSAVSSLQTAESSLVEYTVYVYRIKMDAVQQSNDHVGNDWSFSRYYNNESVYDGSEVYGEPGSSASVRMEITERDKSPDVGYGTTTVYLDDGYQTSFNVTVREDQGRYSGNTATFIVNVEVTFLRRE